MEGGGGNILLAKIWILNNNEELIECFRFINKKIFALNICLLSIKLCIVFSIVYHILVHIGQNLLG